MHTFDVLGDEVVMPPTFDMEYLERFSLRRRFFNPVAIDHGGFI